MSKGLGDLVWGGPCFHEVMKADLRISIKGDWGEKLTKDFAGRKTAETGRNAERKTATKSAKPEETKTWRQ